MPGGKGHAAQFKPRCVKGSDQSAMGVLGPGEIGQRQKQGHDPALLYIVQGIYHAVREAGCLEMATGNLLSITY